MKETDLTYHKAVMLQESIQGMNIRPEGTYVDVTFGAGGHSRAILNSLNEKGRLYAFDQDTDAQANAIEDPRFVLINSNFKFIKNYLKTFGITQVDGILADLGVSSHQFDSVERGFSIRSNGELDMRMNTQKQLKACDIVNTYSAEELQRIFFLYGEISNAKKLANTIVQERTNAIFKYSLDFQHRIASCITPHKEYKYLAQVYQALRIEVNKELEALEMLLLQSKDLIRAGGRLVVISYHSLEDRMVKQFMRSGNMEDKIEKDFYGNILSPFMPVNHKAITPSANELENNNRSRSAKLRIAERRGNGAA
ncbi:MAG: 16S rRNA (cytosine(1402)-N(4))-methyltransferase RsmH [Bacteroidales bacterium]|nr:16S rRNA (cytosine(1402)-N(4))-methyltransferase RsmH [Bacteroidales bacterium]